MQPPEETQVALVIDDDEVFRERLSRALRARGWEAHPAGNAAEALDLAARLSPDLALVDLRMPDVHGLEVVRRLRALDATMSIIVLTGYGSIATALDAGRIGADQYLSKPADADQILAAYEKAAPPESVPSLARVEWEHIQRVLADCSGNISQAAKLLGLHRRSLQRKLSKYPPPR
ncbi:MAG: response regulator transcription factor [Bryobacteraceae bacterium]